MDAISQTLLSSAFSQINSVWILVKILLKFVSKGPINNLPALVYTTNGLWPGDKPLSEPMMAILLLHFPEASKLTL